MAKIAIKGFRMETATHIFLIVFGKTPRSCSSTKLAELSKPEIPSMAALKPKKRALKIPPDFKGMFQFWLKMSKPLLKMKIPQKIISTNIETMWKIKMMSATIALSEIPKMVNPRNNNKSPNVAQITSKCGKTWCR